MRDLLFGFVQKARASRRSRPLHRREFGDRAHPGR
jgi:hypothetical protein